jgi:Transposase DDE domain group 1
MAQTVLPFQYEVEKKEGGMTALAGLPLYLEFAHVMGLPRLIAEHVRARQGDQGWTDDQMITALLLLNLAGGDCVDDLRVIEGDEGFCRLLREFEFYGRTRSERRALKRRWRKERTRTLPSPTSMRDYLELFHEPEQEKLRNQHEAFIPEPSRLLTALVRLNGAFAAAMQRRAPQKTATLDMDATLVETFKKAALYCYKKFKAYQPLNVYWAEQGLTLFSEFRDGNVPAGYDLLRPFKQALELVPAGVNKIYLRSDTAAYLVELLKYCAEGKNERFGVIEFAVGADVTESFRLAVREVAKVDWHSLSRVVDGKLEDTGQEWAEVCFVPSWVGHKKHGPVYRYLAIRESLEQQALPSIEEQISLPFPTMNWGAVKYKITGIVTNREIAGDELIRWYRGRCGKSEEAHSIMKEDLAGGKLPSGLFGANAAWWQIMLLAFNFNSAMKRLVLRDSWVNRRLKAVRFWLIRLPGRVLERGRQLFVRLVGGHASNDILFRARRRMACLCDSG